METLQNFLDQLDKTISEPFTSLGQRVDILTQLSADVTGLPLIFNRITVAVFSTFTFSLILSQLSNVKLRKIFSTLTGLICGFYVHRASYLVAIFQVYSSWILLKILPRHKASTLVQIWAFLFHIIVSLYLLSIRSFGMCIRMQVMINFVKIHMTACNIKDAIQLNEIKKELKKKVDPNQIPTARETTFAAPFLN